MVNLKKILLASIQSRKCWELAKSHPQLKRLPALDGLIWTKIGDLYKSTDVPRLDPESIQETLVTTYPKHDKQLDAWFKDVPEVHAANIQDMLTAYHQEKVLQEIILAASKNDVKSVAKLSEQLQGIDSQAEIGYNIINDSDLSEFVDHHKDENLIQLLPHKVFGQMLDGGIPRDTNTNILLFARPEVGKTALSLNLAYGFCAQGLRVLYVGNEDSEERILLRAISRFASSRGDLWPKARILAETNKAVAKARERGYKLFSYVPLAPGRVEDLWALAENQRPHVMFVDQVRKITSSDIKGAEKESASFSAASSAVRDIGKKYRMITIPVTQANDGTGRILTLGDVYMSKVAVPGDYDLMIGLGSNDEYEMQDIRTINIVKNKISGWHGNCDVSIRRDLSMILPREIVT